MIQKKISEENSKPLMKETKGLGKWSYALFTGPECVPPTHILNSKVKPSEGRALGVTGPRGHSLVKEAWTQLALPAREDACLQGTAWEKRALARP